MCINIFLGHNRALHVNMDDNPCIGCTYDPEKNKNCPRYKPVVIHRFFVFDTGPGGDVPQEYKPLGWV